MSIRSICLERGWVFHGPTRSISRHVTGLLNNGCLLKTVNYGGERGARACGPHPVIKLHTKRRQ